MSTNLLLINTIIIMVSYFCLVQFDNFNNFKLVASSITISRRTIIKTNNKKGEIKMMVNSNSNGGTQKVLLQRERGLLFSYRMGCEYSVLLYTGSVNVESFKNGNKYLIPVDMLKVVAAKVSFIEKCSLVDGYKVASSWTSESFSVTKMETFFWKSQKTGFAGLVGKNVNDSTTIFDILYGLVLLGTCTVSQASSILCTAFDFKGNEGKVVGGVYNSFDRANVTIDNINEVAILITPKAYNEFITSLKVCNIEDNFYQIISDIRFVFAYTSEKIIDSPKKDIGIDPTLLSVSGVKSSRQINIIPTKTSNKEIIGMPETDDTNKSFLIDSPQIRAKKDLSDYACERINAVYDMKYTDDIINIDKLEEVALIHSNRLEDVLNARFIYSSFSSGYATDISAVEEDDDTSMSIITEERRELEGRIAQMMRTMFGKNVPAMIYLAFYAAYMSKRSDKAISKDNVPNNFPFILREEMIIFVNGSRTVECFEQVIINKYSAEDHGTLRLIVDGVDVVNGSMLADQSINSVCEYDHSRNMLKHYEDVSIPTYNNNEVVFFIKHGYEDSIINEGDIVGITSNRISRKTVGEVYVNGDLAVCDLQHDVKGSYFTDHLNETVGIVTSVISSQPWEKNGETLCYSVVTMEVEPSETDSDIQQPAQTPVQHAPITENVNNFKAEDVTSPDLSALDDLDDLELIKSMGFNLQSE